VDAIAGFLDRAYTVLSPVGNMLGVLRRSPFRAVMGMGGDFEDAGPPRLTSSVPILPPQIIPVKRCHLRRTPAPFKS